MNYPPRRDDRRDSRPPEKKLTEVWPNYLKDGYFDANQNLKLEYVQREPVEKLVKAMSQASKPLTMHQLRRFFQHSRAIEAKLKQGSTWEQEHVSFKKLDIAAADADGKKDKKIPTLFHDFIKQNVAAVTSKEEFLKGFLPHFEALVGFGAQYLNDKDRN